MTWLHGDQESSKKKLRELLEIVHGEFLEEHNLFTKELAAINSIFNEFLRVERSIVSALEFGSIDLLPLKKSEERMTEIREKILQVRHNDRTIAQILAKIEKGLEKQKLFLEKIVEEKSK